jgi:hypothetical protein
MCVNIKDRIFSGIIESGDYGIQSSIQAQDGTIKTTKCKDDLDVRPFYFLIKVPDTGKVGLIMLQRTGIYGISNIFQEIFISFFETKYVEYRTFLAQFVSKELGQKFVKNGFIKEINLSRYLYSSDSTDTLSKSNLIEGIEKIEVRLISGRGHFLPLDLSDKASNFMKDKSVAFFDITPFESLGYTKENTTISIKVKEGKRTR